MSDESYHISGRVIDRRTGAGVAGIRVEGWDRDLLMDDRLGSATTDAEGAFSIRFGRSDFGALFWDKKPDIYFKLYRGEQLVHSTERSVLWNLREPTRRVTIALDLPAPVVPSRPPGRPRQISGHVRYADGWPAAGVQVRAVDRDLRSEEPLGAATTEADGAYRIEYSGAGFGAGERGGADLVVRALADDGSQLAASPVLFQAPPQATVDLSVPLERRAPPSLFTRITSTLAPLLGGLAAAELEEDAEHQDLSFLAAETGLPAHSLARFALAHRLRRDELPPEFWFALLRPSVFTWNEDRSVAEQLVELEASFPALDETAVRKALATSIARGDVDPVPAERQDAWVEAFLALAARQAVDDAETPSFLRQALEHAGVEDPSRQEAYARLFNQHGGALTPALLAELESGDADGGVVADLAASYQLADLTQGDFGVVAMLKDEFGIRRPEQVRNLAKLGENQWVELVEQKHAAGEIELPLRLGESREDAAAPPQAQAYAQLLDRRFRDAFPTAAFAGGLERALGNGGTRGIGHAQALAGVLERHPEFDLRRTVIDRFLADGVHPELRGAAADPAFARELKAVQRVYKFAPSFEATDTLRADGIHSARQAYAMGESEFVRRYAGTPGFTAGEARLAWNKAADTHAAVLTVVSDLQALDDGALPAVLQSAPAHAAEDSQAAEAAGPGAQGNGAAVQADGVMPKVFADWNSLFQGGDACVCEHCRSVLGPAAYFADLLEFLRYRKTTNPAKKALGVLLDRRPDLGYLELGCENAETPLPYVDVVCEVLEAAVADGKGDTELAGFTAVPAGAAAARAAVADALEKAHLDPGAGFSLVQVQVDPPDPDRWVVHGERAVWLLKKKPGKSSFFAQLLPNTKAPADELRAWPAYVNSAACDKLSTARFPWILPFDLFAEEVRAAFRKSGLQRWELMRTLRGATSPSESDIAAEHFGISSNPALVVTDPAADPMDEKRLIVDAQTADAVQRTMWGESAGGWIARVSSVQTFLRRTGLEYEELLALLDLPFINPTGNLRVQHPDASCDLGSKVIAGLDAAALDRIHRFLRLWRKLDGWVMWELDLALRTRGIGERQSGGEWELKDTVLVALYHLDRLRARLGAKTTVSELCGLFDDLDTRTRFSRPHQPRAGGVYQSLFLNGRRVQPLDPALDVAEVSGSGKAGVTIAGHRPAIVAALGTTEPDLAILEGLTKASDGKPYSDGTLTLANLSFLWRHAWLARRLGFRAAEWKTVLKLLGADLLRFDTPANALELVEKVDVLKASGFTADELDWLLAASLSARAAPREADAARFLAALRAELQAVRAEYAPARYPFLSPPADADALSALLASLLPQLHRDEAGAQRVLATLRNEEVQEAVVAGLAADFVFPTTVTGTPHHIPIACQPTFSFTGTMTAAQRGVLQTHPDLGANVIASRAYQTAIDQLFRHPGSRVPVSGLPAGFQFPTAITQGPNQIPIRYEATLRFTGVMTAAQRDVLLAAVTGVDGYQKAVKEFYARPWQALRWLDLVFTAPLARLPAGVDFGTLADAALAQRVSYDAGERVLRVTGTLTEAERAALRALSNDAAYRTAVDSLFTQPADPPPADRAWVDEAALQFPLHDPADPAAGHLAGNLATAITRALPYLARTRIEALVVQRAAAELGLAEPLARRLLERYARLPDTLLAHLAVTFAAGTGVVDRASLPDTFDGWYWALRVAALWKKWALTADEGERIRAMGARSPFLDPLSLPLKPSGLPAPPGPFLETVRLLRFRDALPEAGITLFEVLEKLAGTGYAEADFAADLERLDPRWGKDDAEALVSALDPEFAKDYLQAESWERLSRAFALARGLNAGIPAALRFAAAAMDMDRAAELKPLLHARFGAEGWLALSTEIQDVLRERKRDALAAWLLAHPAPPGVPAGRWENTNDLYAFYLLDVEMGACQLTSRLVQASGSVQLFVQRCFMGLEGQVPVHDGGGDGDSAWRWWAWMRKYRVWEANRKVFLWPENWIEPELRKDRSSFFRELENELLQNEIDAGSVEAALGSYLEKLDGVAQLEVAGFYHEDDGDEAILHVFGRTPGAEPHLYWYRRFDYRQWTPWEKVELDIQGDYLVPAVVNRRLFLMWPVFTEIPDEAGNSTVKMPPLPGTEESDFTPKPTQKRLKVELAVSEYRKGKWTPRRVSRDSDLSSIYEGEIIRRHYTFLPLDRPDTSGHFGIYYEGFSLDPELSPRKVRAAVAGAFEISGCRGVPERARRSGTFRHAIRPEPDSTGRDAAFMKWEEVEDRTGGNDLTFAALSPLVESMRLTRVLGETPGVFRIAPPWHLSYFDRLLDDGVRAFGVDRSRRTPVPVGSWLPFFYADRRRTFFVLPTLWAGQTREGVTRLTYPELKRGVRALEDLLKVPVQDWAGTHDLKVWGSRAALEQALAHEFPGDTVPPFSEDQVRALLARWGMRFVHLFLGAMSSIAFQLRQFHFRGFYHPHVCDFARRLHDPLQGVAGLMRRETQLQDSGFSFEQVYRPTGWVVEPGTDTGYPREDVDFTPDGAYAPYNWELFYHAPLLIGNALSRNQRFEEARDWYHFIFNPLGVESKKQGGSPMSKFWITKPFYETADARYRQQRIENLLRILAGDTGAPEYSSTLATALATQVADWRAHAFDPHRIAAYRTVAYQKTVVMKYLDNLIAWGDYLFRQDSMESINEATQLYVLAAEILGPRPKRVSPAAKPPLESYHELQSKLDAFANRVVEVENLVPPQPGSGGSGAGAPPLPMLYFCIPPNEKMLGYWDTVADRLYKIRHCMNIEGVVRQLALFEPPIDPGALVKAVAGGVDLGAALADLNAPLPLYRFNTLLQKANEVCGDVKALGAALLSALEKKDAEALALLRQGQEIRLLEAVKGVREQQLAEAREQLESVNRTKRVLEERRDYYRDIARVIEGEQLQLDKLEEALKYQQISQGINILASVAHIVPSFDVGGAGAGGSPRAGVSFGGPNVGSGLQAAAGGFTFAANAENHAANRASITAGHDRRWEDWKLQERLADRELEQNASQAAAAALRVSIAEKELENQQRQIDNAKAVDQYMRSKYTNQELYQWQVAQISGVFFQSYRLAYDLARRAERCYRFELGVQDSSSIGFGYWDSLKKGLLSGERLQYDLRRLETAYMEQNRREFEIPRSVSLALLDPMALVRLRETGRCVFSIPEELFDLDYPGHYFRRVRSVSLSLPCVAGPYTSVSCTLRLLGSSIRVNTAQGDNGYPRNTDTQGLPAADARFVEGQVPVKAIAASSGQNDAGVFELSFRDERYLPFEGAGAVSRWALELFHDVPANDPHPDKPDFGKPLRQFDYDTITDAVLHLKYTAREDAGPFKNRVVAHLREHQALHQPSPSLLMLNLRRDFSEAWSRFLHPTDPAGGNVLELEMAPRLFPFRDQGKKLDVSRISLLARCNGNDSGTDKYKATLTTPAPGDPPAKVVNLGDMRVFGGLRMGATDVDAGTVTVSPGQPARWKIRMEPPTGHTLDPAEVEDAILVLEYGWAANPG